MNMNRGRNKTQPKIRFTLDSLKHATDNIKDQILNPPKINKS